MADKNYFSEVQGFLRLESEAIAQTATRLKQDQIERVVQLLAGCKGKIVILGVGKSGIIAQKIAATMTSTGTTALHLHPSDALHGGIGIINADDVVMILSNSGETDEIIEMLPYLKRRQVPLIALVGNLNSTLARRADAVIDGSVGQEACPLNLAPTSRADAVIDGSVGQEACPLNLAPTTSTTVALALGDSLALTLMQVKGLTPDDFAINHPAGQLGKRLTMTVADLMHGGSDNPTITAGAVWMAIQRLNHDTLANLKCEEIMTRDPVMATPELLAYDALRLMEDRPSQISVLPVVDDKRVCVGLIRLHDIVRSGL